MDGHHGQTGESAWGRVVFKVSSGRSAAQTIQASVVKGKHAEEFIGRLAGMQSPSTKLFPLARTSLNVYGFHISSDNIILLLFFFLIPHCKGITMLFGIMHVFKCAGVRQSHVKSVSSKATPIQWETDGHQTAASYAIACPTSRCSVPPSVHMQSAGVHR